MNLNNLSAKKICRLVSAGMVFSMLVITGIFGGIMQDIRIFIVGGTLTLCAFFWIWLLVLIFGKRLSHFTSNLCRTLDNMIDGNEELQKSNDSETLFARINHRLIRLYEIMQKNRHKVDMERQELQMLISDISHQVKTPVSNLQEVHDQQGVGIGLYLAREIVTRQGGYIKVVSELRQGSEFSIMLPVR